MANNLSRRRALQMGLGAAAGLFASGFGCKNNTAKPDPNCRLTPEQDLGPFYPITQGADEDLDLTIIQGHTERAAGEVILVRGQILDDQCRPLKNALVEIWSANTHGRYHHEGDTSAQPLDPNFQGWGEVLTDETGKYSFRTIKPGPYPFGNPEDPTKWRTPHLHFKVSCRGYHEIVTQMYFPNEKLNGTDLVRAELSADELALCTIAPETGTADAPVFIFNITLQQVRTETARKEALAAFAGTYELPGAKDSLKILNIRQDGETLFLDLKDYTAVELKPLGKDEFAGKPIHLRFAFHRDGTGKVSGLVAYDTRQHDPRDPVVGKRLA